MSVDPIAIARSGLDVEWQRMQYVAQNLANENSTAPGGVGVYRAVRLLSAPASFQKIVKEGTALPTPQGVRAAGLSLSGPGKAVYDPSHPHADRAGFVTYPDVDHAEQMALLVRTARAYESNLTVMTLAQQMSARALEMGRR